MYRYIRYNQCTGTFDTSNNLQLHNMYFSPRTTRCGIGVWVSPHCHMSVTSSSPIWAFDGNCQKTMKRSAMKLLIAFFVIGVLASFASTSAPPQGTEISANTHDPD